MGAVAKAEEEILTTQDACKLLKITRQTLYKLVESGDIHAERSRVFSVKFGKLAAKRILDSCYYEDCLSLERKATLAKLCSASKSGWSKSKTLLRIA